MKLPARYQLTFFFTAMFSMMLIAALVAVYQQVTRSLASDFQAEMVHDGRILAELFKEELKLNAFKEFEGEITEFGIELQVLDSNKRVFVESKAWKKLNLSIDDEILEDIRESPAFRELCIDEKTLTLFSRMVNVPGHGQFSMHMVRSDRAVVKTKQKLFLWMAIVTPIVILFSALAGYFFSRRTLLAEQLSFERLQKFTADASHELKIPLTSLRGNLEVALRKDRTPTEYKETISLALQEAEHLSKLTQDLLLLAKMDASQLKLDIQNVSLTEFVRDVMGPIQTLCDEKGMRVLVAPVAEVQARFDPDRIRQLIFNLVDNAVKYGKLGGEIRISASVVNGVFKLIVQDDGMGIPAEERDKIFDRFYRIDAARVREQGGVGLGLSIVSWIVDAHKGEIEVSSEEGKGTTFTVRI